MSKQNEQKREEKKTISQTSRLENPDELQLHLNQEKLLFFDCAVALCTIRNGLLVTSNLT
jgi:Neuraminidase (sialidase)